MKKSFYDKATALVECFCEKTGAIGIDGDFAKILIDDVQNALAEQDKETCSLYNSTAGEQISP